LEESLSGHRRIRTYSYGKKRHTREWYNKHAREKKGHMRYSSGPRWTGVFLPEHPNFYRRFMPERLYNPDELTSDGYTVTQTWVALCKCWNRFILAKQEYDNEGIRTYVGRIGKLQKSLGLKQTEFDGYLPAELANIDLENEDDEALMIRYGTTLGN
jgi:hypothetical protein